ncbi:extensin-like domain-containing protein [Pseudoblastomonas halimionae]|uniref:Extensin n=1 Tax=Alteriqipengyuania halimionae TaxID=1926630 RepID=A0A6I4U289_9SPHN|nr:extensin family protein [Alteriqipengyuania halimionae]MXP09414.1 extensin [Alteriqipengyuania halimionae]
MSRYDGWALALLLVLTVGVFAWTWLAAHPQHDPWAPLDLNDPVGWATERKLVALRDDPALCRAVLERSAIDFRVLDPVGAAECRRADRTVLSPMPARGLAFRPATPAATCAVGAAMVVWMDKVVQPAAEELLGSPVVAIDHLGTANCRRIGGGDSGRWSEHATGNAIDIAAFRLEDGRTVSVLRDWPGEGQEAAFLRAVRDGACDVFSTTLSPDYNRAHADHFHLDQAGGRMGWSACR